MTTRERGDPLTNECSHKVNEDCMNCNECGQCSESLNDKDVCADCVESED